jgi:hypothetical protein
MTRIENPEKLGWIVAALLDGLKEKGTLKVPISKQSLPQINLRKLHSFLSQLHSDFYTI